MRGRLTPAEAERWDEVRRAFARVQATGGDDDPLARIAGHLALISERLQAP
jgi:hypothetical protein